MQVFASADLRDIMYEAAHAQDYATGIMNSYFTSSSAWLQVISHAGMPGWICLHCCRPAPHFYLMLPHDLFWWAMLSPIRCVQAVSQSSCSATAWGAQTGPVNEYADAVLAYVYKLHHGTPALDTGCLEPELDAIETYAYLLSSGQK